VQVHDIELPRGPDQPALPVRVFGTQRPRAQPIVVFSHGAYSSGRLYDPILRAWAGAGMVVCAVTHRDSVALGTSRGSNDPRFFGWRLEDMALLRDALPDLAQRIPGIGRLDTQRIAATGHSFGGLVAQTIAGATYFDPATGTTVDRRWAEVRAALVFSGAGRMQPLLRTEDFAALRVPLLVTVGTRDLAQAPGLSGYQWRREPYDLAASPRRWLLTLDGADHYLGGIVGRDDLPQVDGAMQWLQAFNRVSLWFLARWLLGRRAPPPPVGINRLDVPRN
jgi:dienelactone hydrolase